MKALLIDQESASNNYFDVNTSYSKVVTSNYYQVVAENGKRLYLDYFLFLKALVMGRETEIDELMTSGDALSSEFVDSNL